MEQQILTKILTSFDDHDYFNSQLVELFRAHVQSKYPGSKHWDPNKITPSTGGIGVDIDIPGAGRAYHDVDIRPVNGQWLAIPLHPFLVGISAKTQPDLFRPWKKGGGSKMNVLAKKTEGGNLVFMYALSKHVHQRQDPSLLPTDDDVVNNIFEAYSIKLADDLGGTLT